jgi:hypothetical protein
MQACQMLQHPLAFGQQMDLDDAPVARARTPLDEPVLLAARDERDHAVGLGLQAFGELADGREVALRESLDVQQQQVLQGRDAERLHRVLGEALEAADLVTKGRQRLEFGLGQRALARLGHGVLG